MPALRLDALTKTYRGGVRAVDDLSLEVEDGELLVLAGPSGCGKTTTLRLIAGLERPESGRVRIGDRDVTRLPPRDRDVAMVFQNSALYPHLTVRRNLAFGALMRSTPRAEIDRRVAEAAALLGLETLLDRRPGALSGGEQQRAALGKVLVRQPFCALYDEPLSNLDAGLRLRLRGDLRRLHAAARTTSLYVTHDQEDAMALAERLAVMAAGRIVQVGPPREVYARPVNRFVARFLGHPPMNFVEGRLERDRDGLVFTDGAGLRVPVPAAAGGAEDEVVFGIRPEHVEIGAAGATGIALKVSDVQSLGAVTDVTGHVGAARIVVRQAGVSAAKPGERVPVSIAREHVHLFETGGDGRALL